MPAAVLSRLVLTPERGSVTKDAGETVLRGHEAEALIQQRLLVSSEEAGAREHRQIHCAEIMANPGSVSSWV